MLPAHVERHVRRTPLCWQWLGETNQGGYGRVKINGRRVVAHRVVYKSVRGPIPVGLTLDHLCRNTDCVNPFHQEPVTARENILRGNGVAARHAKKTHCAEHGVRLEQQTGATRPQRRCPLCNRRSKREWARRNRAAHA